MYLSELTQDQQQQKVTESKLKVQIGQEREDLWYRVTNVKGEEYFMILCKYLSSDRPLNTYVSVLMKGPNGTSYEEIEGDTRYPVAETGDLVQVYLKPEEYHAINNALKQQGEKVATLIVTHTEKLPGSLGIDVSGGEPNVSFFHLKLWPSLIKSELQLELGDVTVKDPMIQKFREQQRTERKNNANPTQDIGNEVKPQVSRVQKGSKHLQQLTRTAMQ